MELLGGLPAALSICVRPPHFLSLLGYQAKVVFRQSEFSFVMSPHVKLILSLLMVVFAKLNLVHTVDPQALDSARFSSDTLSDSGFASIITTTRNKLGDEGREAQIRDVRGDGLLTGKLLANSDKASERSAVLIIPKHLENNPDKVMAMKEEYNSLETYREALAARISQMLDPVEPPGKHEASGLLTELKKYHEKYLLVVHDQELRSDLSPTQLSDDFARLGSQQTHSGRIEELREILHKTYKFPPPSEQQTMDVYVQETWLHLKTTFEKCVFNTLDYQYQFQLITKEQMKSFFEVPETLQLTARHINDLFSVPEEALTAYHTLIPEMNFIKFDWHTEHLHNGLRELDADIERYLVYKLLQVCSQNFEKDRSYFMVSSQTRSIIKTLSDESIFFNNQYLSPKPLSTKTVEVQEDLMRKTIEQVIHFLNVGRDSSEFVGPFTGIKSRELLLHHYILRFINHYGNKTMKKLAADLIIQKQLTLPLRWVKISLAIHRYTNRNFDYGYFLAYPEKARVVVPKLVSIEARQAVGKEIEDLKKRYTELSKRLFGGIGPWAGETPLWHNSLGKMIATSMKHIKENPEKPLHQNSWLTTWFKIGNNLAASPGLLEGFGKLGNLQPVDLYKNYNGADLELLGIDVHDVFRDQSQAPDQSLYLQDSKRRRTD